jgi:hypothetical protein
MNSELNKKLQERAATANKERETEQKRPHIVAKAETEYLQFGREINDSVKSFNEHSAAESLRLRVQLKTVTNPYGFIHFIFRLFQDDRIHRRNVFEIALPPSIENSFDYARITVREWSFNYDTDNITGNPIYTPGEEPRMQNEIKYKLAIVDDTYEWVEENVQSNTPGTRFLQLVDSIIEKMYDQLH